MMVPTSFLRWIPEPFGRTFVTPAEVAAVFLMQLVSVYDFFPSQRFRSE